MGSERMTARAFQVGDRVRARGSPEYGIGIIEDVNVDPDLSETEQQEQYSLRVVFPNVKVPLMSGGTENAYDLVAPDEVELVEAAPP